MYFYWAFCLFYCFQLGLLFCSKTNSSCWFLFFLNGAIKIFALAWIGCFYWWNSMYITFNFVFWSIYIRKIYYKTLHDLLGLANAENHHRQLWWQTMLLMYQSNKRNNVPSTGTYAGILLFQHFDTQIYCSWIKTVVQMPHLSSNCLC